MSYGRAPFFVTLPVLAESIGTSEPAASPCGRPSKAIPIRKGEKGRRAGGGFGPHRGQQRRLPLPRMGNEDSRSLSLGEPLRLWFSTDWHPASVRSRRLGPSLYPTV